MKARIRVFCPKVKKLVYLSVELETVKDPSMMFAKAQVCFFLRLHGCFHSGSEDCLLNVGEIQGNFGKDIEVLA